MSPDRESRINGNMELTRRLLQTAREERARLTLKLSAHVELIQMSRKAKEERRPELEKELKTLSQQWDGWKYRKPSSST